jgi:hypothetical protein
MPIGAMSVQGQNRKSSMRAYVFRFAPESGRRATWSACPFRATNGSRVLFDHLVGLSEQRGRHGEAERIRGRGAAQSQARSPLRAVLIHPIVSAVLER